MPFMYSEMQNKLSKTRESPLESMGQIISSRCPIRLQATPFKRAYQLAASVWGWEGLVGLRHVIN